MWDIFKSIFLVVLELNIYFIIGIGMSQNRNLPAIQSLGKKVLYGFVGYHVLFWVMAFPCAMFDCQLELVVIAWSIIIGILLCLIFKNYHIQIKESYLLMWKKVNEYRNPLLFYILIGVIFGCFVCVNGRSDVDAQTFIGEITSMLETNRLVGIDVVTGKVYNAIVFRRCCSVFGVNSAVLCRIFGIHPLVFCRFTRTLINVSLLLIGLYELLKTVYRRSEKVTEHAIMTSMLAIAFLFSFTNTIYTSSTFILFRTYEGKAFCAGSLILLSVNIVFDLFIEKKNQYFTLLFMCIIASISISASAVFVVPAVIGIMLGTYILIERKWSYIWKTILVMTPCILYFCVLLTGLSYWYLEG